MTVNLRSRDDLTIVGLGPGDKAHLTLAAAEALTQGRLLLRTARHPVVTQLEPGLAYESFDSLYEAHDRFEDVYAAIVEATLASARKTPTVYATPGHPLVGEATVTALLERARAEGLQVRVVPGLSFLDVALPALALDPLDHGLAIYDALKPPRQIDQAAIFAQLYDARVASELKLALMETLVDTFPVRLVCAAGTAQERVIDLPLYALDRDPALLDHLTSLYVPAPDIADAPGALKNFQRIVARLRAPDGCPWDRAQTHQSITRYLIEETYEVVDALDHGDPDKLAEELGDVLLQVFLHAQIAEDADEFRIEDVTRHVAEKMIRRHPHVFGDATAKDADDVVRRWEVIKQAERKDGESALDGVPRQLPALAFAEAIQRKAASLGFEWAERADALAKVSEEADEIAAETDPERRAAEFGDLLLALVNVARMSGFDAEEALRQANDRFADRFRYLESRVNAQGQAMKDVPLASLLALWAEAKRSTASVT